MSIFGKLYNYATTGNQWGKQPSNAPTRLDRPGYAAGNNYQGPGSVPGVSAFMQENPWMPGTSTADFVTGRGAPSMADIMNPYLGGSLPRTSTLPGANAFKPQNPWMPGTSTADFVTGRGAPSMADITSQYLGGTQPATSHFSQAPAVSNPVASVAPIGPTHTGAVQESNHDRLMKNQDPGNVANFGVQMPYAGGGSFHNTAQNVARNFAAMAGQNQNRRPIIGKDKNGNQVILGYETVSPAQLTMDTIGQQLNINAERSQRNSDRASKERMMREMLSAFTNNRPPAPVPVGSSGRFNAPQLSSLPVAVQNIRGPGAQLTGDPIADKRNIALANARNRAAQAYRRKTIGEDISTHYQANAAAAAQQQTRDLLAAVGDRRLALGQEANDNSTLMRLMGLLS